MLTRFLLSLQDRLHLSDSEFAGGVGLDAETWRGLRTGELAYTPGILARLLVHVPNAHALALEELRAQEHLPALRILEHAAQVATDATAEAAPLAYAA